MRTDMIEAIGIDEQGRPWVKPATATFPYIYREAMEVHWDAERVRLYGPKPREWSHVAWFRQIMDAAREQGVALSVGPTTLWLGIDADLRSAVESKV